MSTARDFLAAVQQRADLCSHYQGVAGDLGRTDVPALVAALTAALDLADLHDETERYSGQPWGDVPVHELRAVITAALTPKENDRG
mgnify:CR=1 FL=1